MQTVKSRETPPLGAHWSMGANHMRRIGKAQAMALLSPHALPRMGYESDVAVTANCSRLTLQNISGGFWLASCTDSLPTWPDRFGVRVIE